MKPVLIQTLFRKMKGRIRLPDPPSTDSLEPQHRDRTSSFLVTIALIAIVLAMLMHFG